MIDLKWLADRAQESVANDELMSKLAGKWEHQFVTIVGNGPSAKRFGIDKAHGPVIVLNGAITTYPGADCWFTAESRCNRWPWFAAGAKQRYEGVTCIEHCSPIEEHMEWAQTGVRPAGIDEYDSEWWKRVVFFRRSCWYDDRPIDARALLPDGGLAYGLHYAPDGEVRPAGTCLMQALHLAAILGASWIDLWGTELCWPVGKEQHADGWSPYDARLAALAGELQLMQHDGLETTQMFHDAAEVLGRWINLLRQHDISVTDHSGGLLSTMVDSHAAWTVTAR